MQINTKPAYLCRFTIIILHSSKQSLGRQYLSYDGEHMKQPQKGVQAFFVPSIIYTLESQFKLVCVFHLSGCTDKSCDNFHLFDITVLHNICTNTLATSFPFYNFSVINFQSFQWSHTNRSFVYQIKSCPKQLGSKKMLNVNSLELEKQSNFQLQVNDVKY